jgi:hypothetical protein
MTPLDKERERWLGEKVQHAISVDQRTYHDAIAWVAFITSYPRGYVAQCWRAHHYGGMMPV